MNFPLPDSGIFALAGISKNSGKTSLLNHLLALCDADKLSIGVLTTGRDGEEQDAVFGNPKPPVRLRSGMLFCAGSPTIGKLGTAIRILHKLPHKAALNELWIAQALRELETEITGPSHTHAQMETAFLMQHLGAQTVLIDGSLDRKSIASHPLIKGIYLVAGGSFGNLDKIKTELKRLHRLASIKATENHPDQSWQSCICIQTGTGWTQTEIVSLLGHEHDFIALLDAAKPTSVYLPGAFTDSVWNKLKTPLNPVKQLIFRHPLCLHLGKSAFDSLASNHDIRCISHLSILAVAVNSWSVAGNHLDSSNVRTQIRQLLPDIPVIDIFEA